VTVGERWSHERDGSQSNNKRRKIGLPERQRWPRCQLLDSKNWGLAVGISGNHVRLFVAEGQSLSAGSGPGVGTMSSRASKRLSQRCQYKMAHASAPRAWRVVLSLAMTSVFAQVAGAHPHGASYARTGLHERNLQGQLPACIPIRCGTKIRD